MLASILAMGMGLIGSLIGLGILLIIIFWVIGIYNRLVTLRNQVKNAWSQIDVQLQRRYDLIPNLVETVKGYMSHERGTLDAVVQARASAMAARDNLNAAGGPTGASLGALAAAEGALQGCMMKVYAVAEQYPDLKANQTMASLQEELKSTENRVAFSRQAYNDQVMGYNNAQEVFPSSIFAGMFGHKAADMYEVQDPEAKKSVKVSFS